MKVLILTGSPHQNGTTAFLADEFRAALDNAGHETVRFDTAILDIKPCLACMACRKEGGSCIHKDDMAEINARLSDAEAVVLVTPLYYFGMTSQLKRVIDRFFAVNQFLRGAAKKLYLIAAGSDTDDWAADALKSHIETMCRYLKWENGGAVFALGCSTREDAQKSEYANAVKKLALELA